MVDRSKECFLGHPKGLFVLFFTELWERFSFYGMKAILVLYMVASVQDGGLGWSDAKGLAILGYYQLLVYLMSVPGGFVADKILGQRKSVYLGGLLLCAGHFLMAYPPVWAFYGALGLIILGTSAMLFVPSNVRLILSLFKAASWFSIAFPLISTDLVASISKFSSAWM